MKTVLRICLLVAFGLVQTSCSDSVSKDLVIFKDRAPVAGVVAKIGDKNITEKELIKGMESDLYEQKLKMFDMKVSKLKELALETLISQQKNKGELDVNGYIEKHIANKIKISDSQINAFIKERKIPEGQVNDMLKGRIRQFLKQEKKVEAIDSWMTKKLGKPIEAYFPRPERPVFEVQVGNAPIMGPENAPVTIVEFSDFQCPYCAQAVDIIKKLKKKYKGKVKFAFKHFPLSFHAQAKDAAIASMCAHEQKNEKFWELHDHMFQNQAALKADDLKKAAKKLGLDEKKFGECLDSKKYANVIEKNIEEGKELSIKSTPTFFVNGKLVSGARDVDTFAEVIEVELKKQQI